MTPDYLRVEEGRTKIIVRHKGSELNFISPDIGSNTYIKAAEQLERNCLKQPTVAQMTSLIYACFKNHKDKHAHEIIRLMKNHLLWGFTGNLYVPNEGVYIQDNPKIEKRELVMDKKDLIKKLESNDSSVRFVPFGFKLESQSALELSKNPYIIGLAGEDGADKLAQIADMYQGTSHVANPAKRDPYVFSFNNVDKEIIRGSAMGSDWLSPRLSIYGYTDKDDGFALGILA